MQPILASTPTVIPPNSSSPPSFSKVVKVAVLGFLATLGGASAQQTFQIGNHTTGLRRASCVEIGNGEIPCEWNKDGDLYKEVFSPTLEVARQQEMTQSGGTNSPSRLFKRQTGDYFSVWATDQIRNQGYDQLHSTNTALEVYGRSQTFTPHATPEGVVLSNGQSVMVTLAQDSYVVYWPLQSNLQEFNDPTPLGTSKDPSLIASQESITSWITLLASDAGFIGKYRYTGMNNRDSQSTAILSMAGGTSTLRCPMGIQFSDGTYLAAFAKISETNQIEGYYYRRFSDDIDNILIDGVDQTILEGSLGTWDQVDAILSVVPGENDTAWVTFIANDDVHVQQVDSSGKIGSPESLGTTGAKEVSSFNITDGPGITWRNASGLFGRIWNRVFPSPTPTPSPSTSTSEIPTLASSTTMANSTLSESIPSSQGQSTESPIPFASTSSAAITSSIADEESSNTMSASSLQESSVPSFTETLSTVGSSSSVSADIPPVIEVEIIPLTVDPFVNSWEVIDGTLHVTFTETFDLGDEGELTLFTFANGEGNWEDLTLEADAGTCVAVSSRIEDNGDGTSSYIALFENNGCNGNAGDQVRPSWINTLFGFFSGIFGRARLWNR